MSSLPPEFGVLFLLFLYPERLYISVHGFLFVSFLLFPFVLFFRCSHSCLHVCLSPATLSGSHVLVLILVFVTSCFILVVPRSWCFPLPNYLVCLYCLSLFFVVSLAVFSPQVLCDLLSPGILYLF